MRNIVLFDDFGNFASTYLNTGTLSIDLKRRINGVIHPINDEDNPNFAEDLKNLILDLNENVYFFIHTKAKGITDLGNLEKKVNDRRIKILETIRLLFDLKFEKEKIRPFSSETPKVKHILKEECYHRDSFFEETTFSEFKYIFRANSFKQIRKYKIFISHSKLDLPIVDSFISTILKAAHVHESEIFKANRDIISVPIGKSIPKDIIEKLDTSNIFFSFISENYMKSPVCLMELGASYFSKQENRRFKLVLPNCNFKSFFDENIQNIDLSINQALNRAFQNSNSEIYKALREIGCVYEADEMGIAIEEFKNMLLPKI